MFISTPVALIIVVFVVAMLILIVWNLSHNSLPQGSDLSCGPGGTCPSGFRCASGICLATGSCRSNNDCTGGDLCISGQCQECGSDDQCPIGSTCTNGRCGVLTCQREEDCPNGFFCDNDTSAQDTNILSLCRPVTCQNNADCLSGQACQNGICMTLGTICTTDRDCRGGTLRCMNGRCQQCQRNSDCPSGSCLIMTGNDTNFLNLTGVGNGMTINNTGFTSGNINAGIGICVTGCSPQCPSGQTCIQGECIPEGGLCGNQCSTSQDCISSGPCSFCQGGVCTNRGHHNGAYCQVNEDCISGNCQNGRCQEQGAECMMGDQTCPIDRPYCVSGRCHSSAEGLICVPPLTDFSNGTSDTTQVCPNNFHCVNGRCRHHRGKPGDRCEAASDCMQGTTCEDVTSSHGLSEKRCRRTRRN